MSTSKNKKSQDLTLFCLKGFEGDVPMAAKTLGRPTAQLQEMMAGREEVDEDLEMKLRRVVEERRILL